MEEAQKKKWPWWSTGRPSDTLIEWIMVQRLMKVGCDSRAMQHISKSNDTFKARETPFTVKIEKYTHAAEQPLDKEWVRVSVRRDSLQPPLDKRPVNPDPKVAVLLAEKSPGEWNVRFSESGVVLYDIRLNPDEPTDQKIIKLLKKQKIDVLRIERELVKRQPFLPDRRLQPRQGPYSPSPMPYNYTEVLDNPRSRRSSAKSGYEDEQFKLTVMGRVNASVNLICPRLSERLSNRQKMMLESAWLIGCKDYMQYIIYQAYLRAMKAGKLKVKPIRKSDLLAAAADVERMSQDEIDGLSREVVDSNSGPKGEGEMFRENHGIRSVELLERAQELARKIFQTAYEQNIDAFKGEEPTVTPEFFRFLVQRNKVLESELKWAWRRKVITVIAIFLFVGSVGMGVVELLGSLVYPQLLLIGGPVIIANIDLSTFILVGTPFALMIMGGLIYGIYRCCKTRAKIPVDIDATLSDSSAFEEKQVLVRSRAGSSNEEGLPPLAQAGADGDDEMTDDESSHSDDEKGDRTPLQMPPPRIHSGGEGQPGPGITVGTMLEALKKPGGGEASIGPTPAASPEAPVEDVPQGPGVSPLPPAPPVQRLPSPLVAPQEPTNVSFSS